MSDVVAAPHSLTSLTTKIENISKDEIEFAQMELIMAMVVLAQMLPDGAIKGGVGIRIRLGASTTRFSEDVDLSRSNDLEKFESDLIAKLKSGWGGFSGRVVKGPKPKAKKDVPPQYMMQSFIVHLSFQGSEWKQIPLEVSQEELDLLEEADEVLASDILDMFAKVGLQEPKDISVISIRSQVAQKLHALTYGKQNRPHDLVDLQLLVDINKLNFSSVKEICVRLFDFRKAQSWPPELETSEDWRAGYVSAASGVGVHQNPDKALEWLEALVSQIEAA
jgi:predicted nucleotidyltransferase component of viral defense system